MALHPDFPSSPYAPLVAGQRWFPADEAMRATAYEKLLPPLLAKVRQEVHAWRATEYAGASATSAALLRYWFDTAHLTENADASLSTFRYYFAQREAVESVIWLYEVRGARDKYDLLRFDASGAVSSGMFAVVAFFARQLLKDLRLVGGYEVLYPKVRDFMREHLFRPAPVDLEDPVVLRNLSEPDAGKILYDSFTSAINALTIEESGSTRIEDRIRLKEMRPFRTEYRAHLDAAKSIFNTVVGEPNSCGFELRFAAFLEHAPDVQAFAKNYLAVGFKLAYVKFNGDLAHYTPDFIVRSDDGVIWIVETKGRAELDLPPKMARLKLWCADATAAEENGQRYDFVFVDQNGFETHAPRTFSALVSSFSDYKS